MMIRKSAFTYLELTAVIVIIAVLSFIIIPMISKIRVNSYRSTCEFNLLTLGMALKTYADDSNSYPAGESVVTDLHQSGYIKNTRSFHCQLDTTPTRDTYSIGYMGGHPSTIRSDDPLIVCGWHPRIGTLAVFPDTRVGILSQLGADEGDIVPITVRQGNTEVAPGFVLHDSDAVTVTSATGEEALIYGTGGAYFISASFDPTAYSGAGLFNVVLGFNKSSTGSASTSSPTSYITIKAKFEYSTVTLSYNPVINTETNLAWQPDVSLLTNEVSMNDYWRFRLTHLTTGQLAEKEESTSTLSEYNVTPVLFAPK